MLVLGAGSLDELVQVLEQLLGLGDAEVQLPVGLLGVDDDVRLLEVVLSPDVDVEVREAPGVVRVVHRTRGLDR